MPDFQAPTYQSLLGEGGLFRRFLVTEQASLVRDAQGVWSVVVSPDAWQLDVATASYIGGYENVPTSEHIQEMIAQGLSDVLYWRLFGEQTFGGGDYGG